MKINYKLINILLFMSIIYLVYQTKDLWNSLGNKMYSILFPFFMSFIIAYTLYPIVRFFQNKGLSKVLSVILTYLILISSFVFLCIIVLPMIINQITSLFNAILAFIKEISMRYDIDEVPLQKPLKSLLNKVSIIVLESFEFISTSLIVISSSIYLLIDMDRIREKIKTKYNKKYNYIKILDISMRNYLNGFIKIIFITFIEYSLIFLLIGHPNAILLGILAAVGNLIPYFGGIITNIIASITAFMIGSKLFIKTLITFIILSFIDSYIINPYVYGKSNNIHPVINIFSIFTGGILFGLKGIILALPITILIIETIKYNLKKD